MKRLLLVAGVVSLVCASYVGGAIAVPAKSTNSKPAVRRAAASVLPAGGLQVRGIELFRGGKPVVLRLVQSAGLRALSPEDAKAFLKSAKAAGAQAVLTNAFTFASGGLLGDGGKVDEAGWPVLDALVASAREEGLGLFLTLSSGAEQARWTSWAGSSNAGVFFRDFKVQQGFRDAVKRVVNRVNPKTHTAYGSDPTLWGWVLCDDPVNAGGSPAGFNHWVVDTAAFLHGLSPRPCVALGLSLESSEGINPASVAGAAGVDFVVLHLSQGIGGKVAADWALQVGRPVIASPSSALQGSLGRGVAGLVVAADIIPVSEREGTLRRSFVSVSDVETPLAGLFRSVELAPGPASRLKDDASARVKVTMGEKAKLVLRWDQDGPMDGRLDGPETTGYEFSLGSLTADHDLSIQVEAHKADGTVVLSDRKTVHLSAVAPFFLSPAPEAKNFITVKDGHFYDGDKPWRYVGTNNYYLNHIDAAKRDGILADSRALGMKVIRIWAFGEGVDKPKEQLQDWEKPRFFTLAPGKYNEENLKHLDELVAAAGKHGIRLICALSNNWADYGGAPQWAAYFGYKDKDDFFDKPEVQKAFLAYVKMLLTRVNTVTGVAYKDDPTIFAWDLMNEPQYKRDQTGKVLAKWVSDTSAFIKGLGAKQLITTGLEGHRAAQGSHYSGTDYIGSQQCPTIDFATFHIYPAGEYSRWNLDTTKSVITDYVRDGHAQLKKPVVMEEFGIPKTDPKYDKPVWIRAMMKTFFDAGGDGVNYWMIVDPEYRYGDGNEFDRTMTETANTFSVTAKELEASK